MNIKKKQTNNAHDTMKGLSICLHVAILVQSAVTPGLPNIVDSNPEDT